MVLLWLNTVDHGIECRCGLQGKFLVWFNAYLENRTQVVIIDDGASGSRLQIVTFPRDLSWPRYCIWWIPRLGKLYKSMSCKFICIQIANLCTLLFSCQGSDRGNMITSSRSLCFRRKSCQCVGEMCIFDNPLFYT